MIDIQQLKRELAETEAEVAALTQEQTELALEESQLSQRLEEVKKRQSELRNGYHRFGLIGRAKERHRRLQLKLTDLKKRLVVWTLKRNWSTRECDYVVSRVTAKRIAASRFFNPSLRMALPRWTRT